MKNTFFVHENPFLKLLIPFLAGIFLGDIFAFQQVQLLLKTTIMLLIAVFITLNFGYKTWEVYKRTWLGGLIMCVFLLISGILTAEQHKEINQKNHFSAQKANELLVRIIAEPKKTGKIFRFNTWVVHTVFNGKISESCGSLLLSVQTDSSRQISFKYGNELLIESNYQAINAPFNPAEFNYSNYLRNQNIYFQEFIRPNQYQLVAKNRGNPLIAFALSVRQKLVDKLKKHLHDPNAIAVASTLILGYRADLSADVRQAYTKTGTMHVLSVSGMHVALVYLLIDLLLRFLNGKRSGVLLKAVISVILIWIYALITGFSPSVCRAALMITFVITGKTYNKHISTLNILLVSAFILLLYNPFYLLDVGFQLSYLAVFGLIVLQPVIEKQLDFRQKFVRKTWSLISVSIAAQIVTFPVSIFYFHQFPVYFLISNLFIVLPSMLVMYFGIAFLLLPEMGNITNLLALMLEKTILLMNQVLAHIEHLPFGSWNKIWISTPEYLLLYAIICCVFGWMAHRKPLLLKLGAVFIVLLLSVLSIKKFRSIRQQNITFLNLNKHLGLIFKTGNQAVVISDLQTSDKIYQYSVQPYLDSCKISSVVILKPNQNFKNTVFSRQNKLIQFQNQLIYVADKAFESSTFTKKIKVDAVFITQNPKINLNDITGNLIFERLIIGTNNYDYLTRKLATAAANDGRKINILKRNKAVVLESNL